MSTYTRRQRMSTPGTVERPLCVAVIGSGPSGFYAAEALLKTPNLTVRVDVFDRLPTPFGLSRPSRPSTRRWPLTHMFASLAT